MKNVTVDKDNLLGVLKANKEKHAADYADTYQDWVTLLKIRTDENVKKASKQRARLIENPEASLEGIYFTALPPKPVSYEKDYERAIRMVEMSAEQLITLESEVFNQLVLDEWH